MLTTALDVVKVTEGFFIVIVQWVVTFVTMEKPLIAIAPVMRLWRCKNSLDAACGAVVSVK